MTVRFDFTYDRSGFFNEPDRRAALQRAADAIAPRLQDDLAAIVPSGGNSWQASFYNPVTDSTVVLNNPTVGRNEVVVYVAAAPIGESELGLTTTGGYSAAGGRAWLDTVRGRGQAGALSSPKTDYSTWGGMVTFDSLASWSFATGTPAPNQYDFESVAIHELMHVFGFGLGEPAFTRHVGGGFFAGPTVVTTAGGPVSVVGDDGGEPDHWAPQTTFGGLDSPMEPALLIGTRRALAAVDYAALNDIGWDVDGYGGADRTSDPVVADPADGVTTVAAAASSSASGATSAVASAPAATPTSPPTAGRFAAGTSSGAIAYGPDGEVLSTSRPVESGPTAATRVASADVTGDGVPDLVAGSGPGRTSEVSVTDGSTGREFVSFQPFEAGFTGGVFVAAGDINGDGRADVVVTPDESGGPVVAVYDGAALAQGRAGQVARFMGLNDPRFRGGARAALGDVNGDGTPDLVVSAGVGGGPRVAVFDGRTVRTGQPGTLAADFFAFETDLRNGAYVTAADLDGDGFAEVIAGAGPGGAPRVTAFSGQQLLAGRKAIVSNFFAGATDDRGGVRVAALDVDADGRPDVVTGSGSGGRVGVYSAPAVLGGGTPSAWMTAAVPGAGPDGVFVG